MQRCHREHRPFETVLPCAAMPDHSLCPWWMGYVLLSPFRALRQSPQRILAPYVSQGMTVLDVGCAMGYFSLPLARMVGPKGTVLCVDVQPRMLSTLQRRARRAGLADRIEVHQCGGDRLGLDELTGTIDLTLLFAVVHETPSPASLMEELAALVTPGSGRVLLAEPRGHVTEGEFAASVACAVEVGLSVVEHPRVGRSHAVVLARRS